MPDEQAAGAAAEEEEEDRDCPVCLEDTRYLPGLPVTIPCCRKVYCRPCIIALVGAHKGSAPVGADGVAKSMAHTLICPTCRAEHHVPGGRGEQWACKLALDSDPSKWGGTDARSALLAERDVYVDPTLCAALSREELIAVCAVARGVHHDTARAELGHLDRPRLVAEAALRLGSSSAEGLRVSELSVRAARSVLTLRDIPFGDCLEKAELTTRVEQCHRGACSRLPIKLLKHMLEKEGLGDEIFEDKENLARRIMAVRSLRRQHQAWHMDRATPPAPPAPLSPPAPPAPPAPPYTRAAQPTPAPSTRRVSGAAGAQRAPPPATPSPAAFSPAASTTLRFSRPGGRSRADREEGGGCQCVIS
ncbi:hypothetical protein KFE25_010611 [Diacronema lutheri]|uniref:RING-type domain-containing protein n=2 Tax=Diacronema lutheri TaxID=2081491 RepID=A0A8J6C5V9_DIALT|nr:hypothetical protein KFE25_010611 [Diacronema lutheri]